MSGVFCLYTLTPASNIISSMERRTFIKNTAILSVAGTLISGKAISLDNDIKKMPVIKPARLSKNATIGLITPASAVSRSAFEKAIENMESFGFNVRFSENMRVRKGFIAGTDQQRLTDIHSMFENPDIHGIVCARGGYGTGRLLSKINYDIIKSNPKIFIGYSDITALLMAIYKQTGLICFHGPVGASEFSEFTSDHFKKVLIKGKGKIEISQPKSWDEQSDVEYQFLNINGGKASGELVGGNLSLLTSLMGTPYDVDFKDKIVFIEEVGESPYRLDRMITQLLNSGKLSQANGIAMGIFKGCETGPDDPDFGVAVSIKELIMDRFKGFDIPVVYGLPIGHIDDNATLPIGVQAELDADKGNLTIVESAVL